MYISTNKICYEKIISCFWIIAGFNKIYLITNAESFLGYYYGCVTIKCELLNSYRMKKSGK